MKPFFVLDSYEPNTYVVFFEHPDFMGGGIGGSYHVIGARIMGFSYPNYLRYMRDNFNGVIHNRQGYSYMIYKSQSDALMAAQELNKYWTAIEETLLTLSLDKSEACQSVAAKIGERFVEVAAEEY